MYNDNDNMAMVDAESRPTLWGLGGASFPHNWFGL